MSVARLDRLLTEVVSIRPRPIARERYDTFTILEGPISGNGNVHPRGSHDTLDAAIEAGVRGGHKTKFVVRQFDELTERAVLKFYAVKRKSKAVHRYHDYQTRAVHDLYAEHLVNLREDAISMRDFQEANNG